MQLLVLDDDEATGRLITRIAALSGMNAVAVTEADAFARELDQRSPQVVMLDLQLNGTDGVEQMRFLAQQRYTGTLVLMSGYDSRVLSTARELGHNLGLKVCGCLEKPVDLSDLEQLFERIWAKKGVFTAERLRAAIANDELVLDFQPVVSRNPNRLRKLEALVRWEHPVAGAIAPSDFLPLAESDTSIIDALTDWVTGAAVAAYQVLDELGITTTLSVNVSPRNLHDLSLPNRIERYLRDGGMPAQNLCLEITESAAFGDPSRSMDILSRLRLKGIQLSIDDFGTGYSSFAMLRQMPFTEIKIDKSFIRTAATSRDSRIIAKCIVDLATNMGMDCVAEGVEDDTTASLLEDMGAPNLQGYFFARPMPIEAVPIWLDVWLSRDPRLAAEVRLKLNSSKRVPQQDIVVAPEPPSVPAGNATGSIRLPPQQLAVMRLLAEGCSVKEIARRLGLGIGTVKVHLSLAYSALGAHNRIEAVMRALPLLERDSQPQAAVAAQ
jgi:EAL domain-containing protein (putative c-di-GMP-specific phosphodiesterase class I)/DNA-binding CsgD family transcriptional regulator/ActR/RegA family two-component response regulator